MSKLKINHYIPNKKELKKQKEILDLNDLKNKKKRRLALFYKVLNLFLKIFITLFLIFILLYFFYIKNIFNLHIKINNIVNSSKTIFIQNYYNTSYFFNSTKEKFVLLSDNVKDVNYNKIKNNQNNSEDIERENQNQFVKIFKNRLESAGFIYASSSVMDQFGDLKIYVKNTLNNNGYIILNTNLSDPENI